MRYLKNYLKKSLLLFILCIFTGKAIGQELNFNVEIDAQNIEQSNTQIFRDMKNNFQEFLNSRQWTDDRFGQKEKIFGNMVINITENPQIGLYKATVQVQSSRPVYNTSYESIIFNYADRDWVFEYSESQPLDFNENTFTTNLTAMLGFYAYLVLGYDYDTFGKLGGQPYFRKAYQVAQNAQQEDIQGAGWQLFENNRNRINLIEEIMNPQFNPIREALYQYHRLGLDIFEAKPEEARQNILEALKKVQQANKVRPNSLFVRSFFDSKRQEIIKIFSEGEPQVRRDAYNVLIKLDPTNRSDYDNIIK